MIIGKDSRFKDNSNGNEVGPGNYESHTMFADRQKGQNNFPFSKEKRFKEQINDLPGPGNYELKSKFSEMPGYVRA